MKNILLLLVIGGVLLTHLPVRAENLLYQQTWENYYRTNPELTRIVIDSDFDAEERDTVLNRFKAYFNINQVIYRQVRESDKYRRDDNTITVCKFEGGSAKYLSAGTKYKQVGNYRYYNNPFMYTDIKSLDHELGHVLGLDHDGETYEFIARKKREGLRPNNGIIGIASIMSYGSRVTDINQRLHSSDIFHFNKQAFIERNFVTVTVNLPEYDGAELLFLSSKDSVTGVRQGNYVSHPEGYSSAIGNVSEGVATLSLPRKVDKFRVYVVPQPNQRNLPNPLDRSGLDKPKFLGNFKVEKDGTSKFSRKLKKLNFRLLMASTSTLKALKQQAVKEDLDEVTIYN